MMFNEYIACVGRYYYLFDLGTNEGYSFSEYGKGIGPVNAKYVLSISTTSSIDRVNILSILHDSTTNISELYYQGYRCIVKDKAVNIYKRIPKNFNKSTYIPFRIVRADIEGLIQILVPFKDSSVSFDMLNSFLGNVKWDNVVK